MKHSNIVVTKVTRPCNHGNGLIRPVKCLNDTICLSVVLSFCLGRLAAKQLLYFMWFETCDVNSSLKSTLVISHYLLNSWCFTTNLEHLSV